MPNSFAAVALIVTADRKIPVVRDPRKAEPLWKFPGGTSEAGETPQDCVIREVKEETGIDLLALKPTRFELVATEERGGNTPHTFYAFVVELTQEASAIKLASRGDEGEEVRWSDPSEIIYRGGFLDGHFHAFEAPLLTLHYGMRLWQALSV